jgi:hypothetical protein
LTGWIKTGLAHEAETHPIRLALGLSRKCQLLPDRNSLPKGENPRGRIATASRSHSSQDSRRNHDSGRLALLSNHARNVSLGYMADLMGQDRHQFRLRLRLDYQSRMHTNIAAGNREGIDASVANDEELEFLGLKEHSTNQMALQECCLQKPPRLGVKVILDLRIIRDDTCAHEFLIDRPAQSPLFRDRELVDIALAQCWQIGPGLRESWRWQAETSEADDGQERPGLLKHAAAPLKTLDCL